MDLNLKNEDKIQAEIVQWSYKETKNRPDLWLLFHVPNGGWRGYAQGMRFKALGVKPGVQDLVLPVPRGIYHGLFLEVKFNKGKQSDAQKEWEKRLTAQGYAVGVVRSKEEGIEALTWYLDQQRVEK